MKLLRIGLTSYINSYPYVRALRGGAWEVVQAVPRELNALLREGQVDIALISPLEYARGDYHFLAPFGIGALEEVMSVNLYLRETAVPLRVHKSEESTTSVRLLEVLCAKYWQKELVWEEGAENALIIGDKALQDYPGAEVIDLAKAWWECTHKGFVFALLATPKATWEAKRGEIEHFCNSLHQGLEEALADVEALAAEVKGFDRNCVQKYFSTCRYLLGEKELQGLELFLSYV